MGTQASGSVSEPFIEGSSSETSPLIGRRKSTQSPEDPQTAPKLLSTRHAFPILVSLQIGSGIFASPAQVDGNVPSPAAALIVWILGGLLSWTGAASFAELGASLPLNGGMQEYLQYIYGDTMAFLMAWIYIMAVKPSAMAILSIVIAESVGSVIWPSAPPAEWLLKVIAVTAMVVIVLANSINTKTTMRLSESFTFSKIGTVALIVLGGVVALFAHFINPDSALSGSKDWYSRDWFKARPTLSNGHRVDWTTIGTWEQLGHYSSAIYAGLWAYDGWDNVSTLKSPRCMLGLR